jgi:ATP-citrate lyase beta-subunit
MSRVKLTEYRAKKILLGDSYRGISVHVDNKGKLATLEAKGSPMGCVAKVDQGVKKRMKQGLVVVGVNATAATRAMNGWKKKGFTQFVLEPLFPHAPEEEQYFSIERVREGLRILHAREGGIDIESHPEDVHTYTLRSKDDVKSIAQKSGIPESFLNAVAEAFEKHFFAFLEINPLVIRGTEAVLLDAAVLVDSAGAFFADAWTEDDIVASKAKHKAEERIEEIAKTTPASLKLNVLNKNGSLFFLLSGGGGSIVVADEAHLRGAGDAIGNYGEYSGGPTREETYLYAKEVLNLLITSKAKRKALVIAGGVANFTDIAKTFAGIIDALTEAADKLRAQKVKVFIRRGGPNEAKGLAHMKAFLEKEKLLGSVHGSDIIITKAVEEASAFVTQS